MLLDQYFSFGEASARTGRGSVPWDKIGAQATAFVERESPASIWPFQRSELSKLRAASRKVLIHYFPFFELSFENGDLSDDHWAAFLRRQGVDGRFGERGGFARERPLTPPPWPSPYWREINATIDILRARLIGADGFGLDIPQVGAGRQRDLVHIMCEAAAAVAPDFKIALEPGMAALGNVSATDLANELIFLAASPAVDRLEDGRLLVIPFAADRRPVAFWTEVLDQLQEAGNRVAFVPDFLDLVGHAEQFRGVSFGETLWGPRDPVLAASPVLLRAEQYFRSEVPVWMAPVAPQGVSPKVSLFWESENTQLFRTLWMQAINDGAQYVHILTWNDYGESTEVQPSSGTQFLFYDLCAFYIQWFKFGEPPVISRDVIYYCHRTEIYHDGERLQDGDQAFKLMGRTPICNDIEIIALLTKPAFVEIEMSGSRTKQSGDKIAILRVPARPGKPTFRIYRDGEIVLEQVSDWYIREKSTVSNPVYFGGSTARPFVIAETSG